MIKRLSTIAMAALLIGSLTSCILDPKPKPPDTGDDTVKQEYMDLTEEWHVLNNLELSYKDKNIARYQDLFDPDNFTFFFAAGDVANGDAPTSWGYSDEIASATKMFSQQPDKNGQHPILTIDLKLFDKKTTQWTDVTPPPEFPGETWRNTTVDYNFEIVTEGELTYIPQGTPKASFTVRQIDGKWKLVEWQDLANN